MSSDPNWSGALSVSNHRLLKHGPFGTEDCPAFAQGFAEEVREGVIHC